MKSDRLVQITKEEFDLLDLALEMSVRSWQRAKWQFNGDDWATSTFARYIKQGVDLREKLLAESKG